MSQNEPLLQDENEASSSSSQPLYSLCSPFAENAEIDIANLSILNFRTFSWKDGKSLGRRSKTSSFSLPLFALGVS